MNSPGDVSPALAAGILRAALDAVIVIDHASRVVEWNAAAERTFGYPVSYTHLTLPTN